MQLEVLEQFLLLLREGLAIVLHCLIFPITKVVGVQRVLDLRNHGRLGLFLGQQAPVNFLEERVVTNIQIAGGEASEPMFDIDCKHRSDEALGIFGHEVAGGEVELTLDDGLHEGVLVHIVVPKGCETNDHFVEHDAPGPQICGLIMSSL